jgi:hypothetical protein
MRSDLWGASGDLDYWSALARGEVAGPEQKAVDLLRRVVDPERFHLYCMTGQLPIMGNVTKRSYFALKSGGALEMEDGAAVAWWCFSVGPYAPDIPDTDQVLSVRMIVEGEELSMFTTGDRHPRGYHFEKNRTKRGFGIVDPFVCEFVDRKGKRPDRDLKTSDLLDLDDLFEYEEKGNQGIRFVQGAGAAQYVQGWNANNFQGNACKQPVRRSPHEERLAREERANGEAMGLPAEEQADSNDLSDNLRDRIRQQVQAHLGQDEGNQGPRIEHARAYLAERLPGEVEGLDMHDGTMLHVDRAWAQQVFMVHGVQIGEEVRRMQEEGHPPANIEYALNNLLFQDVEMPPEPLFEQHQGAVPMAGLNDFVWQNAGQQANAVQF